MQQGGKHSAKYGRRSSPKKCPPTSSSKLTTQAHKRFLNLLHASPNRPNPHRMQKLPSNPKKKIQQIQQIFLAWCQGASCLIQKAKITPHAPKTPTPGQSLAHLQLGDLSLNQGTTRVTPPSCEKAARSLWSLRSTWKLLQKLFGRLWLPGFPLKCLSTKRSAEAKSERCYLATKHSLPESTLNKHHFISYQEKTISRGNELPSGHDCLAFMARPACPKARVPRNSEFSYFYHKEIF